MFFAWELVFGAALVGVAAALSARLQRRRRLWERSIDRRLAALEASPAARKGAA